MVTLLARCLSGLCIVIGERLRHRPCRRSVVVTIQLDKDVRKQCNTIGYSE